jgi:hypothetical protein
MMKWLPVALLLPCLFGCAPKSAPRFGTTKLEAAIRAQEIVDLAVVFDSTWDTLFVVQPYTPQSEIAKRVGREIHESGIEVLDSFTLLVFVREGHVAGYAEAPRRIAVFDAEKEGVPKADAKFRKQMISAGGIILKRMPNQPLEPTSTLGTSAARQPRVPSALVAHL